jgi:hypothetical protein
MDGRHRWPKSGLKARHSTAQPEQPVSDRRRSDAPQRLLPFALALLTGPCWRRRAVSALVLPAKTFASARRCGSHPSTYPRHAQNLSSSATRSVPFLLYQSNMVAEADDEKT